VTDKKGYGIMDSTCCHRGAAHRFDHPGQEHINSQLVSIPEQTLILLDEEMSIQLSYKFNANLDGYNTI
jgi:hypothetical protein